MTTKAKPAAKRRVDPSLRVRALELAMQVNSVGHMAAYTSYGGTWTPAVPQQATKVRNYESDAAIVKTAETFLAFLAA